MRKIIFLISVFFCFAITANAQPITDSYCWTTGSGGGSVTFGCEYMPQSDEITLCFDESAVYHPISGSLIVKIIDVYITGSVEYNGVVINYETPPQKRVMVFPKSQKHINVNHFVWNHFLNVKLSVSMSLWIYDSEGDLFLEVDNWTHVVHCNDE